MSRSDEVPMSVRRRVQLTGGSTYIVSIPKEWARLLNIDKGDEVLLELTPTGAIKLTSTKAARIQRSQRSVEIRVSDGISYSAFLMEVLSSYLAGYDTIRISFDPSLAPMAERIASEVKSKAIGLELLEESDDHLTLRIVVDPMSISPQMAIENIVKVVKSMFDDLEDVLGGQKDKAILEAVVRRDDIVDKLYLYIFKQLNLALQNVVEPAELGMQSLAEAINIYGIVKSLERIADQAVQIAQWLLGFNGRVDDELRSFFAEIKGEVERVVRLALSRQQPLEQILRSYDSLHRAQTRLAELQAKERRECAGECYPLIDGMRRILAQSIDLLESLTGLHMVRSVESSLIPAQGPNSFKGEQEG